MTFCEMPLPHTFPVLATARKICGAISDGRPCRTVNIWGAQHNSLEYFLAPLEEVMEFHWKMF
jgi:hypothetical protein